MHNLMPAWQAAAPGLCSPPPRRAFSLAVQLSPDFSTSSFNEVGSRRNLECAGGSRGASALPALPKHQPGASPAGLRLLLPSAGLLAAREAGSTLTTLQAESAGKKKRKRNTTWLGARHRLLAGSAKRSAGGPGAALAQLGAGLLPCRGTKGALCSHGCCGEVTLAWPHPVPKGTGTRQPPGIPALSISECPRSPRAPLVAARRAATAPGASELCCWHRARQRRRVNSLL